MYFNGRDLDCGSKLYGFKPHQTSQYTHLVQWLEHQAYTLGVEGSNPSVSTILEYLSGLRAQSAKLMIREFKSHLQVKQII